MSSATNVIIRPANRSDVPTIVSLVRALAEYERLAHEMTASEDLFATHGFGEHPYFHTLIAEDSRKKALGFALYFFTFSTFLGKPSLYLEDLVPPAHRGNGIGKKLLQALAGIARERGCGRMEWSVLDWNEPAIAFYRSLNAKSMDDWKVFRLEAADIELLSRATDA